MPAYGPCCGDESGMLVAEKTYNYVSLYPLNLMRGDLMSFFDFVIKLDTMDSV